jgi:ABC-type phosphate transport system substrate-binding protein
MNVIEKKVIRTLNIRLLNQVFKTLFLFSVLICCSVAFAQKNSPTITISGGQLAKPLIAKWINEYSKVNPGISFEFSKGSAQNQNSDLHLIVNSTEKSEFGPDESIVNIGRVAVLPIINEKNQFFPKQLRNGIKQEELKNIFLQSEVDITSDAESEQVEKPLYTVYTQANQSPTAKVLLSHFGKFDAALNGVLVTGDDQFLVESILTDSSGVTYSNLGLIYDLTTRTPLKGIKIIPIDPDDNGKLKKEELVYDNLDQLISFLESSKYNTIPSNSVSFKYNSQNVNPLVADFVAWVANSGQQFNHQYGLLKTNEDKNRALTAK